MVLAFQGCTVDPGWLRRVLESTKIGTPGFKVRNLEQHGYAVSYSPATDDRVLLAALGIGVPPIALVFTGNLSYWNAAAAHALVVVGVDDDVMMVNDPAFPTQSHCVPRNEFLLAWSDFDYLYALISPKVSMR